ncbi:HlyD family efflux transporter periplasmic adaptor subunit [Maribellus comscasis]|uniref:HlyD family efflux transporter periplasmic adaptor subunit n=1 Tax=Maribellus comscasis TaxID=2681766 RepID=A0A6I6JLB5_9BACT|nr:HlyD family efflux transporter periplasmic adaptor subunit [Maribellus comscasis]QGY43596.1 HlyD family efflux transporter periplasmic adaptor subunit [Maribellus comscasis]
MKKVFPPEIIKLSVENHFNNFSRSSRIIYLSVTLFIVGFIISLFFIETRVSVQSAGLIRSLSESIEITSPVVAEISRTNIAENQFVHKGDTLICMNAEKLIQRGEHLNKLIIQNEDYQADLRFMSAFKCDLLKTGLYKSIYAQYRQKLEDYDLKINLLKKSFNRTQTLFDKNVIPLTEKEEKEFQLQKAIEEKNIFVSQSRSDWQQLATEYKLTNKKYKNEIIELQKELGNYAILSPCTGYITNFSGIQAESFVTTGQRIAVVSPDDKLISEHLVPPRDIGYLKNSMPVVFQVDAYNYSQWGFASGEIIDISNEIYLINNQPYFKVRCSLNEQYLLLKNGFKGTLKKGLTTTARFQITERTLAQLLFDKAEDWLNPKLKE